MDVRTFLRLVMDPVRLALLGRAAEGTLDVADVAHRLGIGERTVLAALGRLRGSGLITEDLRLDTDRLRQLATELPQPLPADPDVAGAMWSESERKVLAQYFSGARLAQIPSSHGKRLVVLERLAQEFEPGMRYEEPDVNFKLQMFHADYATLRRYLVDEGMLTRAEGVYWRTGGRYEPTSAEVAPAETASAEMAPLKMTTAESLSAETTSAEGIAADTRPADIHPAEPT